MRIEIRQEKMSELKSFKPYVSNYWLDCGDEAKGQETDVVLLIYGNGEIIVPKPTLIEEKGCNNDEVVEEGEGVKKYLNKYLTPPEIAIEIYHDKGEAKATGRKYEDLLITIYKNG